MGQNEKKSDIQLFFGNVSNIHSKMIFSYRGYKSRNACQISGHLVLFPRFYGCLKLKKREKLGFFMQPLNWKISIMLRDIEKRFSVPSSPI
jgi:hypothetical protein